MLEFPDDIACMFLILKYQKDKKKLLKVVERFQMFQNVSEDAYDAVWTYTNSGCMGFDLENSGFAVGRLTGGIFME